LYEYIALTVRKTSNAVGVLINKVEMFETTSKGIRRVCRLLVVIVRKSIPSGWDSTYKRTPFVRI